MITLNSNLKAGEHKVRILSVCLTDSMTDFSGSKAKERITDFVDPNPQIGAVFAANNGTFPYRFSLCGYKKFSEMSEDEISSYNGRITESGVNGYALFEESIGKDPKTKKDIYAEAVRIKSDRKTEVSESILANFLRTLEVKNEEIVAETEAEQVGLIIEAIKAKIVEKHNFILVLKDKEYDGKNICDLSYTKKIRAEVEVPELADDANL
jgi:hypothetical protein